MKEISEEEFRDRAMALQRAEAIFIESGLTNNITKAFIAYQAIFAERERHIFLSTRVSGNRPRTMMDRYDRPRCPEDGFEMMFRIVPENKEGIKVQLVCTNTEHTGEGSVLNSENDLQWWMDNLRIKDGH